MSARQVLRDLRTERGETPATDRYDELLEAAELQREGTTEPDATTRELASQVLDEAGAAECLRALFPGFRPSR